MKLPLLQFVDRDHRPSFASFEDRWPLSPHLIDPSSTGVFTQPDDSGLAPNECEVPYDKMAQVSWRRFSDLPYNCQLCDDYMTNPKHMTLGVLFKHIKQSHDPFKDEITTQRVTEEVVRVLNGILDWMEQNPRYNRTRRKWGYFGVLDDVRDTGTCDIRHIFERAKGPVLGPHEDTDSELGAEEGSDSELDIEPELFSDEAMEVDENEDEAMDIDEDLDE